MADDGRHDRREDEDRRGTYVIAPVAPRDRHRPGAFAVALGAIAVLVVGLSAWGVLVPPPASRSPAPAVPSARPSAPATPDATPAQPEDLGLLVLATRAGWADCPLWRGIGVVSPVAPAQVALARTETGVTSGRLPVDDQLGTTTDVWIGVDAGAAVRDLGGVRLVREGDVVWTEIDVPGASPAAVELVASTLDDGTTFWQVRARVTPAPYCAGPFEVGPPARVVEVGTGDDPLARLFVEAGIDTCRSWRRLETTPDPGGDDIDQAIALAHIEPGGSGWIVLPSQPGYGERQVRAWVGDDPREAGAEHGSSLVVLQPGDPSAPDPSGQAWLEVMLDGRIAGVELRVVDTPSGFRAWLPTPNAAGTIGPCASGTAATGGTTASPAPGASSPGATSPDDAPGPTVELLRGGESAFAMLIERFAWNGCRILATGDAGDALGEDGSGRAPDPDGVDAAARSAGLTTGWVVVLDATGEARRVWLGDDLVPLARAANVGVVAVDGGVAWLADPTRAVAWRAIVTPDGRTAWYATDALVAPDGPCPSGGGPADPPGQLRSLTCWTDRDRCLEAVRAAMGEVPSAFAPGTEVAAGVATSCPPGARCPFTGPNDPVIVTAAAPAWSSSADVRAFSVTWRPLPARVRELGADEITASVLAMASRPARPLPVSTAEETAATYCPAAGITGTLHGSRWDPRVAWVGPDTVRWPAGTTARFLPDLELVAPGGHVYPAGAALQVSGSAGADPVFVACRITGVDSSTPLPSGP